MKILNLYAGIGGNRKLWKGHQITAIENNPEIAKIYQDLFPQDEVIISDAHQYLLDHFKEFDFIWSSPPCPSHSSFRKDFSCNVGAKPVYPDMKLYEEILLLQGYFKDKYIVENVIGWYKPLIAPYVLQRHYFWTNFLIADATFNPDTINLTGGRNEDANIQIKRLEARHDFNLDKYKINKRLVLRNCVNPELGKHILDCAMGKIKQKPLL